jgi:RNA polymerase sigma factor (sigma-70 family)
LNEPTDGDLLARCRGGDEEAWRLLVERYAPLILSIPRRYGLRAAQADDVFADVCLALVRALSGLRDPKALPQWLIRTTSRATWEVARKAKVKPPDDLPPLTGAAPPEEVMSQWEEEQLVRDALAALPERCRKLLTLLYFDSPGSSYDEVAAMMGMPRGSLGPTRSRCLEKLRQYLEPKLDWDVSGGTGRPPRS